MQHVPAEEAAAYNRMASTAEQQVGFQTYTTTPFALQQLASLRQFSVSCMQLFN
jgi:hypothetical protein